MSRSNGDSSAARPENGWPSSEGSTRHVPLTPSTTAGSPGLPHVGLLDPVFRPPCAGDAQGAQPPLVADAQRLLRRDHRLIGVDPFCQVPQPVPALAPGDRDLAPPHHVLQQLRDVAVVGPPGRPPRHLAGVRKISRGQRARGGEPAEDVPAARVVGPHPVEACLPATRLVPPLGHLRAVQRHVLARPDHRQQFEQLPVPQRVLQLSRRVRRSKAAPCHQIGVRRDGRRRVDLQQGEVTHRLQQTGRPLTVQQLRAHRDAARIDARKLMDGHRSRLTTSPGSPRMGGLICR